MLLVMSPPKSACCETLIIGAARVPDAIVTLPERLDIPLTFRYVDTTAAALMLVELRVDTVKFPDIFAPPETFKFAVLKDPKVAGPDIAQNDATTVPPIVVFDATFIPPPTLTFDASKDPATDRVDRLDGPLTLRIADEIVPV